MTIDTGFVMVKLLGNFIKLNQVLYSKKGKLLTLRIFNYQYESFFLLNKYESFLFDDYQYDCSEVTRRRKTFLLFTVDITRVFILYTRGDLGLNAKAFHNCRRETLNIRILCILNTPYTLHFRFDTNI